MTFGSLFAGIGGFDLGLERAGMTCEWQVEIDDYATKVLEKHWPHVKRYRDVREVGAHNLEPVDLICGGFPCQDISDAGHKVGITGQRSGLWGEYARIIRELRPHFVLVENVSALLDRGMGRVLGDLAGIRYDAEWRQFSACEFGLSHMRKRVFILAYPSERLPSRILLCGKITNQSHRSRNKLLRAICDIRKDRLHPPADFSSLPRSHGLSRRLGEIAGYGNAVCPDISEWIGRRIMEASQ